MNWKGNDPIGGIHFLTSMIYMGGKVNRSWSILGSEKRPPKMLGSSIATSILPCEWFQRECGLAQSDRGVTYCAFVLLMEEISDSFHPFAMQKSLFACKQVDIHYQDSLQKRIPTIWFLIRKSSGHDVNSRFILESYLFQVFQHLFQCQLLKCYLVLNL